MTPRHKGLLVLGVVLVVYNIWQWWPQEELAVNDARQRRAVPDAIDLRLAGQELAGPEDQKVHRDLFHPVAPVEEEAVTKAPATPPAETLAVDRARQQAEAALGEFQLVGILFQGRDKKAFLRRNEENYTVAKGDKISGKFVVDNITVTSVTLRDMKNKVEKTVELQ